ncbi:type I polyketide synthase [Janthinobacterium sp. 17J80-10]|uniref:type I polyketide synthase n=1 Tax=Janthinobacterium sp. 17J80-10 TaxID=2497863 RepID=UPI0013E8A003|nr:type I polyketide synthase [Janthinobacterium sp. 17J80-10]
MHNNDAYDDSTDDAYDDVNNDIAIIGMAGRFPKADNIDQFWANLVSSTDCITRFSREELERMGVSQAALDDPNFVPAAGFIPDQDKFDAHFFEMNPREAANLDPQHRFALEVAWQTLEHAGYTPESVNGSIGVFAGVNMSTYFIFNLLKGDEATTAGDALDTQISVDKDMFASRISYKLNLNGPSIALGTACSTSLVCIHLACQSLLNGESKMALAGGSHLATPNCTGHIYHQGGYSSPDGYCRAFDAKGQGTVGGAGTCFVLLKRLDDALADNDTIYAVIKGSAVNNDGSEKIGYTAPSIVGQTNIIAEAQAVAGVEPDSIRFIEAHGTATELGDPIEFTALTRAFRLQTEKKNFCGIGSVKSNIGHLGMAAGAASVVKAALSLKHKVIPESLNFEKPNPKLDIDNSPFYVIDKLERIEEGEYPARAGVSSLGIGGTNAHVVLEEPPATESSGSRAWQLLLLAAKTPSALDRMSENLADWMKNNAGEKLADAAYTLQVGRKDFAFRRAFVLQDDKPPRLAGQVGPAKGFSGRAADKKRKVVFMFPGGGTQHVDMARGLYEQEPAFRASLDECAALFRRKMGLDLVGLIYPDAARAEENAAILQKPKNFFAALFAVEYSLAKLWMSWGVKPDVLVGHSLGEYTAACIAGVFSLEDAVSLICCRGALFEKIEKGAMLSVTLPADEVRQLLIDGVSIATINDPGRCVVAGRLAPMQAFEKILEGREVEYKRLLIDTAGHSPMVDPILQDFGQFLSSIKFGKPSIPFISNMSGDWADPAEIATAAYWKNHLRQTVRFSDGIATLLKDENTVFVEVGPGNALCSFVRSQLPPNSPSVLLNSLRHVKEEKDDQCHLLETLGKLWLSGIAPDWKAFHGDEQRKRIALPGYPFERKRYWVENRKAATQSGAKLPVADWFWQPAWRLQEIAPAPPVSAAGGLQTVLAFVDGRGILAAVAERLRMQGARAITVTLGESFAEAGEHQYRINAAAPGDYVTLLQHLRKRQVEADAVLHGWSLDRPEGEAQGYVNCQLSFVYLAQALDACLPSRAVSILAVTADREAVLSGDQVDCLQALVAGPARVIPYEFPHVRFATLDIHAGSGEPASAHLTDAVAAEMRRLVAPLGQQDGDTVALRHGLRFVRDFIPMETAGPELDQLPLRQDGVYVITGGLGGVGLAHAQALAAVRPRLVLLQRAAFPAEQDWDAILAEATQDAVLKEQIRSIRELRAAGAQILLLQADVTDAIQLAAALAQARAALGRIHGLVHCAGYGEFVPLRETSRDIIEAVLAPKVRGTRNLLDALAEDKLDLVLLCSSMSVATTGYGLAGYVAACAYLDAVAQSHRITAGDGGATRYLSINWDVWSTPLQTARAKGDPALLQRLQENKTAILPREGVEVIHRALASGKPQTVISTVDFQQLLRKNRKLADAMAEDGDAAEAQADGATADSLALYERPSLSTEYVAPSSPEEKLLAAIWQETLGIAKIGIHDNFFELGGESLLGVKIVVKAKKMGLLVDPKQMFATPTIAQIAQSLNKSPAIVVEQGEVSGAAVCAPVQQQFLDTAWADADRWNVGLLVDAAKPVAPEAWNAIVAALVSHHDALRSHFVRSHESSAWQQVYPELQAEHHADYADLSGIPADALDASIQSHCQRVQEQMHIQGGPVCKLACFKLPDGGARLAIIAHHLVMDALSLGVVLEDLTTLVAAGEGVSDLAALLPPKTSSYKAFAEQLAVVANTDALAPDIAYWQQAAGQIGSNAAQSATTLPEDFSNGSNRQRDAHTLATRLSAEATQALQEAARATGVKFNELLIAGMARTVADWQGSTNVALDVVGHGRPDLDGLDLGRTVGWFGSGAPLFLQLQPQALPAQLLGIKAQIDAVPRQGLSLSWLTNLHDNADLRARLAGLPRPQVSLNYLGQVDLPAGGQECAIDALRGADNHRLYQHEIAALIQDGCLELNWTYSTGRQTEATVRRLLDNLAELLQQLAHADWTGLHAAHQRSHLPDATLAQHGIVAADVEDCYALTALQSEIYHRYRAGQRSNVSQALSVMEGPLDRQLLQAVWQALVARHKVLRTRFIEDDHGVPLQVVCRHADFALTALDYSHLDEAAQQAAVQALMAEDRCKPYDLTRAPALRLYHITLAPQSGRFAIVLSNHQIILDGWTSSLVSKDLLACLLAMVGGAEVPPLADHADFGQYVRWLAQRPAASDEAHWRKVFSGYRPTDPLAALPVCSPVPSTGEDRYASHQLTVDAALLDRIQECARASQTTANAVFQAAWALSLAQVSGSRDIVYGVTVSGRSADYEGIAEVVGQCTNSLPVRLAVDAAASVTQLLQAVHGANADAQAHAGLPLARIAELLEGEGAAPLYSSNFIFENIPRAASGEGALPIRSIAADWVDGWHFPLRVFVVPEEQTWVRFAYDNRRFASADVLGLAGRYHRNLASIVARQGQPIASLMGE